MLLFLLPPSFYSIILLLRTFFATRAVRQSAELIFFWFHSPFFFLTLSFTAARATDCQSRAMSSSHTMAVSLIHPTREPIRPTSLANHLHIIDDSEVRNISPSYRSLEPSRSGQYSPIMKRITRFDDAQSRMEAGAANPDVVNNFIRDLLDNHSKPRILSLKEAEFLALDACKELEESGIR